MKVFLGVDVGKTNLRVGVFDPELRLVDRWSVATADVRGARAALDERLRELALAYEVAGTGISIFGPLQVDAEAEDYGALIESSDAVWSDVNIPKQVAAILGPEVYFDFDVSAGALAEAALGAGRGRRSFVYVSVGTGVGGVAFGGGHVAGYAPQLGHIYLPREADDLEFAGTCRFHGGCLQGLASGRAMEARWGAPAETLGEHHPAWDLEARYLARACTNLIYTFAPECIVLGSSVGAVAHLPRRIEGYVGPLLNGFLEPALRDLYSRQGVVVRAELGTGSSLMGAALLAARGVGLRYSR